MSAKPEAERVEAVHKTGSQWKRAEGREFEDHIEMVSLGRPPLPAPNVAEGVWFKGLSPNV
jgi:hypothetical protein